MDIFTEESLGYALEANLPHAFWLIGRACANGIGETRDTQKAEELFERGARLGSPLCQRDGALLKIENSTNKNERSELLNRLAELAANGYGNLNTLTMLIHSGVREHRAQAIRWLQHELVFNADWRAGFALYLALLFPNGRIPKDKDFLFGALSELAEEKPHARKALAFGLLSGGLTGRCQVSQAIRLLNRGTTPNEMALAALVTLEHSSFKSPQRFMRAEHTLFISTQAGSSIGNALLLRLTLRQTANNPEPICRAHIARALNEHMANYPMHADEESLRVIVHWLAEDSALREKIEHRLRKTLMRSSDIGMCAAIMTLARLSLNRGDASAAVDRLRKAALRGHRGAAELLGMLEMRSTGALSDTEGRFWEHITGTREMAEARQQMQAKATTYNRSQSSSFMSAAS